MSSNFDQSIRKELTKMLLSGTRKVPTSSLGRLGRTAMTALRSGRMILRQRKQGDAEGSMDLESMNIEAVTKIVSTIGELKGVAMKMGQIMSYIDIAFPEELRSALAVLQTHAHPMDFEWVRGIIEVDLEDNAGELVENLEETPIAAASIGQVHRSRLADGTDVAVKVQYPEINSAIESDFRPASVGTRIANLFYPGAKIEGFINEARERFLEECDYLSEARYQRQFGRLFKDHPLIAVPEVHVQFCSGRVLTTTYLDGARFDEFLASNPEPELRDRIGQALFEFYIGTLFKHGLYNCDPHPGNYLFLPDGRIGMLDYGCCREFEPDFLKKIADLTLAVHRDERETLHRAFEDLGMVSEGKPYDYEIARGLVRSFFGPMLKDQTQAVDLGEAMDMRQVYKAKRELMKLSLPGEFLFLFRIRFGLMSVLAELGSRANWYRLERGYIEA